MLPPFNQTNFKHDHFCSMYHEPTSGEHTCVILSRPNLLLLKLGPVCHMPTALYHTPSTTSLSCSNTCTLPVTRENDGNRSRGRADTPGDPYQPSERSPSRSPGCPGRKHRSTCRTCPPPSWRQLPPLSEHGTARQVTGEATIR